jgi:uncharacterized protein YgiM (DUF1202 family)
MAWTAPSQADEEFPYTAQVTTDQTYYRSGPGNNFYPAGKLNSGDEVEVYRHDPGGWCAIRPPQGSFSWVSVRQLKITEDDLAVVSEEGAGARVGSDFSNLRDVQQVRMKAGEEVSIVGDGLLELRAAGQAWCKIAPPAGEFRWIDSKFITRTETTPERNAPPEENFAQTSSDERDSVYARRSSDELSDDQAEAAWKAQYRQASSHAPVSDDAQETDEAEGRGYASRAEDRVVETRGPVGDLTSEEAESSLEEETTLPEDVSRELEAIDLALSAMVIEEPNRWSFARLRRRAEAVMDGAAGSTERGRARRFLGKLDRWEEIQQRHSEVAGSQRTPVREAINDQREVDVPARDDSAAALAAHSDRYDGVGRLTRVVSRQVGSPSYALVDETGRVGQYVSPAPGVNLRQFVGKQVGISGARGYMPNLDAQHVTAKSVTPLDRTLR